MSEWFCGPIFDISMAIIFNEGLELRKRYLSTKKRRIKKEEKKTWKITIESSKYNYNIQNPWKLGKIPYERASSDSPMQKNNYKTEEVSVPQSASTICFILDN